MKDIGTKRSAGISGWISGIVGFGILYHYKVPFFSQITVENMVFLSILVVFAILFIFLPVLRPETNLGDLRYLPKFFIFIGSFLGIIMGLLVAVLIP